jgi:plastocyanin
VALPASGAFVVRATSDGNVFRPKRAEVNRGTRVVWRAVGGSHTVTAYGGGWSKNVTLSAGERTGFTFDENGRFRYRCTFHSSLSSGRCTGMCGKVIVG